MFIGFYSIANAVTLLGLVSAVMSCFLSAQGNFKFAVIMLVLSAICDMFDGRIARSVPDRTEKDKSYGIQLDSLCDIVSFGVAPAFIAFNLGFSSIPDLLIYLFFIVCGAIRLAYFNTLALTTPDKPMKHYRGLPIPASSFAIPILVLLMTFIAPSVTVWLFRITFFGLGLCYILNIKIKKPSLRTSGIMLGIQLLIVLILLIAGDIKVA